MENLKGKFVTIERPNTTYEACIEIFVMHETPGMIHGIKPMAGYEGHSMRSFPRFGEDAVTVLDVSENDDLARELANGLIEFSKGVTAERPQWISSVYENCKHNGETILRMLNPRPVASTLKSKIVGIAEFNGQLVVATEDGIYAGPTPCSLMPVRFAPAE